jgi:uncharacterized protein (TIGR02421 family)
MGGPATEAYKEHIKRLSTRIVEAQRPIRVLDAIKWDPSIDQALLDGGFKEIPKLGPEYYARYPLSYDPVAKIESLREIAREVDRDLGSSDAVGALLKTIALQYVDVIEMLQARGTARFGELSRKLYGSTRDFLYDDKNTIRDLGTTLYGILSGLREQAIGPDYPETIESEEVVRLLNERFNQYFPAGSVEAKLSDGIVADAAAGGDAVKIKEGARFSMREVEILEVHEGWVHVGTTQNGQNQRVAKWLSKGPPRVAATQEGLAVIMEIFTFRSFPRRARQINDRIIGIHRAEEGASVVELAEFYRTEGYSEQECLYNIRRVYRGGTLEGGAPFTKDISYCRGFIENYNFMRAAIRAGKPYLIPFLFAGKLQVDDVPLIYQKYLEGVIDPPVHLPPQFRDLNGVAVWMSFSSFLNAIDLNRIQEYYDKLFKTHL